MSLSWLAGRLTNDFSSDKKHKLPLLLNCGHNQKALLLDNYTREKKLIGDAVNHQERSFALLASFASQLADPTVEPAVAYY